MTPKIPIQAAEYLSQCFRYQDGKIYWLKRPISHFRNTGVANSWNAKWSGKRAGKHFGRYRQVGLDNRLLSEHRIIAAMHGMDITQEIDHRDGDTTNNRIENLRPATHQQNTYNSRMKKISGFIGVYQVRSQRWVANIRVHGRQIHLGTFDTEAEAIHARQESERTHYGQFAPSLRRRAHAVSATL